MIAPLDLPTDDWASWLQVRVRSRVQEATGILETLKDGTPRPTIDVLERWNDADILLLSAESSAGLMAEVHPDETVRELADTLAQEVSRAQTDLALDRALFEMVVACDPEGLDAEAHRLLERVLRDFRRAGVDRAEADRDRLRAISDRLTTLAQDFGRAVREDVRRVRVTTAELDGLPVDFIAAHPAGADGLHEITTDYPDAVPVRTFARDRTVRERLAVEFLNRAWPANDEVLREILELRHEQARLLGFEDWPSYDADVKMVGSSDAIAQFIGRLAESADAPARRDRDVLLTRRRQDEPDAQGLDVTCTAYYSELVRREQFGVDAQEVRRYFDFERVRAGLLEVTGRLFGVRYEPVPEAPRWHADVAVYDVVADGAALGRIHLDLHPRDGKFKHAAQFDLVGGVAGRALPEGVLVCNFSRGLMEHDDVVTLFHEFGHLVHHVLGGAGQRWVRFSGVATEWDFVEAPSQMLEEWAWDPGVLRSFAVDDDGRPIPAELVARMRGAKDFGKGMWVRNQLYYTALSYELHRERPSDISAFSSALQARYDLGSHVPGTHMHASFGHLVGYTSAYYTYLWSLVIAKDLFAAFDRSDLFASEVAHRYRDRVLAPGGSKDAAVLVEDFLGRPFTDRAFAEWLGREPERPPV